MPLESHELQIIFCITNIMKLDPRLAIFTDPEQSFDMFYILK